MTGFINNEIVHKTAHEETSVPITAHGTRSCQHGTINKRTTNGRAQRGTRRQSCPTWHGETANRAHPSARWQGVPDTALSGKQLCPSRHVAASRA